MAMLIDLFQLRTFVAVAEEKHLTRAAERIHISQSAASAHIRAVEDNLDTQLFIRTNRSMELTHAGELLFQRAKALLGEAAQFTSYARELSGKLEGMLVLSTSSDPQATKVGEIIAHLRNTHSLIKLDLRARPSSGTRHGLKSGEIDVGLLLDRPIDLDLFYYQLARIEYVIAGPVAWKDRIESATLAELAALPWLTPHESSMAYASMLVEMFASKGLELNTVIHFDNAAIARNLLLAGAGMMLMRRDLAEESARQGQLAISPIERSSFSLYLAHLASRKEDPLIRAFVESTQAVWPEMTLVHSASR